MKYLYTILLVCIFFSGKAQTGYFILRNCPLPVSPLLPANPEKDKAVVDFITMLIRPDQESRQNLAKGWKKILKEKDSLNFSAFEKKFSKEGYFSQDLDRFKKIPGADMTHFPTDVYVLHLHFSDQFGLRLIDLIISSFPKGTCNEKDLMNYIVTYLWRNTEFPNMAYRDQLYHAILLPDMKNAPYAKYIRYAFDQYMKYCGEKDPKFSYLVLTAEVKNNEIDWPRCSFPSFGIFNSIVAGKIKERIPGINFRLHDINAGRIKDGTYNILLCSHPGFVGNPAYTATDFD